MYQIEFICQPIGFSALKVKDWLRPSQFRDDPHRNAAGRARAQKSDLKVIFPAVILALIAAIGVIAVYLFDGAGARTGGNRQWQLRMGIVAAFQPTSPTSTAGLTASSMN